MLAAWTTTMSNRPMVSTNTCRLRPLTFFPRVVAAVAAAAGRLDRLAVQDGRRRLRLPAGEIAGVIAEGIMHDLPGAVLLPTAEVAVDAVPGREVVRQRPPGAAGG